MNALSEIGEILTAMKIPWQTGAYTEPAPDQYVVLVPLGDTFDIMADNRRCGCPFSPRGTTI